MRAQAKVAINYPMVEFQYHARFNHAKNIGRDEIGRRYFLSMQVSLTEHKPYPICIGLSFTRRQGRVKWH